MMDDDLRDLLAAYFEAAAAPPGRQAALLARLDADPGFRQAVAQELHTLGQLRAVQSGEPLWLRLADALGHTPAPAGDDALAAAVMHRAAARRRRRAWRAAGLAVAAALLGAVAASLWGLGTRADPRADRQLAVVTHLDGVEWAAGQPARAVGDGLPAGPLRVRAGRVVVRFWSGVVLSVQGEAEVDLLGRDAVYAAAGRVRVRVPPGAEGFTVRGAGYEVVDLGTEFGLTTAPGGNGLLRVFEGRAAVSVQGTGDHPVQSRLVESDQSVEVDPVAQVIRTATIPDAAFATLPARPVPENSPLALAADYPAMVRAANPWGYWRFEAEDRRTVPNEVHGRPGVRLRGRVGLSAPGGNRAAVFPRGEINQSLLVDGLWTPPRATGYAVEFWAQATPARPAFTGRTTFLAAAAERDGRPAGHLAIVELYAQGADVTAPCAVRLLDRWPPGDRGGTDVFTGRAFAIGRWHHVVGQRTPDRAELYLDGALVGSSPAPPAGPADTAGCRVQLGQLTDRPAIPGDLRPFDGQIDEVALYDRPLTPDEVRRHAAGGRPAD